MNPTWTDVDDSIVCSDGKRLKLLSHEFWYLAPSRATFSADERNVGPLDFSILLHNAFIGNGLVVPMRLLLGELPLSTEKRGAAAEAEELLEKVRAREYPNRPSRMRCHYLNFDKPIAEQRVNTMFRKVRLLTRCFIAGEGPVHLADVGIYERLEGRPHIDLARKYWEPFLPKTEEEVSRVEVLVDTALYFPDWRSFPTLSDDVLIAWQAQYKGG